MAREPVAPCVNCVPLLLGAHGWCVGGCGKRSVLVLLQFSRKGRTLTCHAEFCM